MKTGIAESMLLRRDDSELVLEVGPLAIFRGSSLAYKDGRRDVQPAIRPYYTVAINPYWLDEGGEVELCIEGDVRIIGTSKPLEEERDLFVQVREVDGRYDVLVMDREGELSSHLQLERVPETETENHAATTIAGCKPPTS
jgi:hypothetical protein